MITFPQRATRTFFFAWTGAAAAMLLAGCATNTRMTGEWVNPDAGNRPPAKNVLVIGINRDSTARRIYEDAVVAKLAARGVAAQPSYKLVPEFGPDAPPDIETTLRETGVDAVLVSRTVGVSTDIRVTPGRSYAGAGFHGMWGGSFSTEPRVYTLQKVEVDSRLFDVKDLAVLWSGSSTTNPTESMQRTIDQFAAVLTEALADAKLIP